MAADSPYPVAPGKPQLSGKTIPQLFASETLVKFYDNTFLQQITNTDYEGMIKNQGDEVTVTQTPDTVISDHQKGIDLDFQDHDPDVIKLPIDRGKSWAIRIDDVDVVQSHINIKDDWTSDAARALAIEVERVVLDNAFSDADSNNSGNTAGLDSGDIVLGATGTPLQLTKSNIVEKIIDAGTVLDENLVPPEDRWIMLPPWAAGLIKKGDLKDASLAGDPTSIARTGLIGMIDTFKIFKSTLINNATDGGRVWNCMFGHPTAITFATQIVKTKVTDNPNGFDARLMGLHVFGFKVMKPQSLGLLYIKK